MNDRLKEWKLVQSVLGLAAASAVGFYLLSGSFQARDWFIFLPPSPTPNTFLYHVDSMRQALKAERFSEALGEAEWVLQRDKENPEAVRGRAACLLRVGRFAEAEKVFRVLVGKDKKDIPARLALATALRGQGDEDKARLVLLRIIKDPNADSLQKEAARAGLNAMDFKESLFPDQPTPRPKPSPSPSASPSPEPLRITAIKNELATSPDGQLSTLAILTGSTPTRGGTTGSLRPRVPLPPAPTPDPGVAPVVLPERPIKPTPTVADPGETEPLSPELSPTPVATRRAEAPLEIPPPTALATPTPTPRPILPATIALPRRILPATLPTTGKKLPPVRRAKPVVKKKLLPKQRPPR